MSDAPLTIDPKHGVRYGIFHEVMHYVDSRQRPASGFVQAMIRNDCFTAVAYAPVTMTMDEMRAVARLIFNHVPGRARGSLVAYEAWINGSTPALAATPQATEGPK